MSYLQLKLWWLRKAHGDTSISDKGASTRKGTKKYYCRNAQTILLQQGAMLDEAIIQATQLGTHNMHAKLKHAGANSSYKQYNKVTSWTIKNVFSFSSIILLLVYAQERLYK